MRSSLRTLLTFALFGLGCSETPVGLDLRLPRGVKDKTVWLEVAAFKDASCESLLPMLPNGVPDGFAARASFRSTESGPEFGVLPNGTYAFAATARDKNCAVLALGCKEVDVGKSDNVVVLMDVNDNPAGRCAAGSSCQAGRCVPANDNLDPSVGAGCSLELLGAGPLPTPDDREGTLVSAPAVAATPGGFIVVYREVDANGASSKVTILPLDPSGGALKSLRPSLPEPCADSEESDGIGLVVTSQTAMIALAKAPCADKPQLQLLNFTTAPAPALGKFIVSPSPSDARVALGAGRPSTARPQGNVVVFSGGGVGRIASMDPEKGIGSPSGSFGGANVEGTWVAANEQVLALLAVGKETSSPPGEDSGAPPADPPIVASKLRLLMVPANTPIASLVSPATPRLPIPFPGEVGSLAVVGGRVIVLSDGTGGRSVTYRAFDLNGKDEAADSSGFSVEGDGPVTAVDATIVGNRAFFAALKKGAVALNAFDNATTILTPLRGVSFGSEPRISGISTVRDGRVSVAATDSRVAVAWTTAKKLRLNDASGGYAVFACTK